MPLVYLKATRFHLMYQSTNMQDAQRECWAPRTMALSYLDFLPIRM